MGNKKILILGGTSTTHQIVKTLKEEMVKLITKYPKVNEIQYLEIVDPETLKPKSTAQKGDIVALAVYVGTTRLIDNIQL